MSTNTSLAVQAKAILDAHDAPLGPSKADTIKALAALIAEPPADLVREQLVAALSGMVAAWESICDEPGEPAHVAAIAALAAAGAA